MSSWHYCRTSLFFLLGLLGLQLSAALPDRDEVVRYAAKSGERLWSRVAQDPPAGDVASRDLFTYALALCEAKQQSERLERLFEVAGRMQDRDPQSRGYGNFRWSWSHPAVQDFNAVDFCMQGGALLWLRHRETMTPHTQELLREILNFAVQGCRRHRVAPSYTNIALMNAGDLILLGEAMGQSEVADEGYARLDRVCLEIWENGIHEYGSPTYYGVDLDDLILIEAFCARERGRLQARALLELFWTDIAANWLPGAQKLAGAHSRDYDYLRGLGMLDTQLWLAGWLSDSPRGSIGAIFPALGRWQPPARLRILNEEQMPRLVRQMWGPGPADFRTHYLLPDITLGSAGGHYANMDLPLTVDFAGPRESVRCYFIPDGRHDPYGKIKIQAGLAHQKTLHLTPFFVGAQRQTDALGMVLYRKGDVPPTTTTLESHFVMPAGVDEIRIGDRQVDLPVTKPFSLPVKEGEVAVLRRGGALAGVRVLWTRDSAGLAAPVRLIWDGNAYGALRLTVDHRWPANSAAQVEAGAAFWIRIGDGLNSTNTLASWQRAFASARYDVAFKSDTIQIRALGKDDGLAVGATAPFKVASPIEPMPQRVILDLDGEDVGRRLLRDIEPIPSFEARRASARLNQGATGQQTALELPDGELSLQLHAREDGTQIARLFLTADPQQRP